MADAVATTLQLRLSRREKLRLLRALLVSLAAHLLLFGGYKLAQHYHWQPDQLLPRWLKFSRKLEQAIASKQQAMTTPEPPLMFVNVSPAQAAAEAPPNTKYYSDKSSLAANPEADKDTGIPKITGAQEQIVKTEDTQRNPFDRLQPALPAQPAPPQEEVKAKPAQPVGDLTMAKPDFNPRPDTGVAERPRPRTLQEARARLENSPPGEKMKQEAGVKRRMDFSGLDVSESPIGRYDAALVNAISQRWYDLLDSKRYDGYQRGKVVLQFALNYDGRITDMKVLEATVKLDLSLVCEMAVLDPAPYAPWPSDMRRMISGNQRIVTFTFFYN
jgi:outer membrane biosynthesis protein TonB